MKSLALIAAAVVLSPSCLALAQTSTAPAPIARKPSAAEKPETPHLDFVTEYIRELAAVENIRESGQQELKQDPDHMASNMIHSSTLFQLELASQIRMLKGMRLKPPEDDPIPIIIGFYEDKIIVWKRMGEIGTAFIGGQKPGVDYDKLAAEMPQLRARLDYIDQSLLQAAPLVFATLIDVKPDSKGHVSHLIITKEERAKLIDNLDTDFGPKLDEKSQSLIVGAASVLKGYLLKDFKSSDEPWE